MNKRVRSVLIYSCIFILSLIPCLIMFNKGFIHGHDNAFHYAQIQDLYDSIKAGNFNFYLNYETIHSLGMGVRLMYASLSHFVAVFIGLIIIPFGFSLTSAMKLTIFLSILLSGIFTYWFIRKVTNKELPSILAAAIYIMFPYRYTDIYIRNALAETIAMTFIPLVFYGVYGILKQKEFKLKPYIATTLGITLLFFTHNLTTIYTIILVGIFALFHYKDLARLIKQKSFWIPTIVSCIFILCFMSILLVPMLEHMKLGIHRIFDGESMRTTYDLILEETKRSFLFFQMGIYSKSAEMFLYYVFMSLSSFGIYWYVRNLIKTKDKKNIYLIATFSLLFLCFFAMAIANKINYIIYIAIALTFGIYFIPYKKVKDKINKDTFVAFVVLFVVLMVLIFWGKIWKILPSKLYSIQFPWRLWAFVGFVVAAILGIGLSRLDYANSTVLKYGIAALACGTMVIIKPLDKEEYNFGGDECYSELYSISIDDTYSIYAAGWQLEYFTTEFYNGSKSSFWWKVYSVILNSKNTDIIDYIGVIEGSAVASNYKYDNGVITFDLDCKEHSLIEVARVYYLGYEVTITTEDGNVIELEPFARESFVAFNVNQSGSVKIEYVGTVKTNMTKYLFGTAGLTFVGLTSALSVILKKKELQELKGEDEYNDK